MLELPLVQIAKNKNKKVCPDNYYRSGLLWMVSAKERRDSE